MRVNKRVKVIRLIITVMFALIFEIVNSQNYLYYGDNKYKSTPSWSFHIPTNASNMLSSGSGILSVSIAKKDSTGAGGAFLMLSTKVSFTDQKICGLVILYLSDGSTIKCYDKGIYDNVNSEAMTLYYLTFDEIKKLKILNIDSIRFSTMLIVLNSTFPGSKENYEATNKYYNNYSETKDDIIGLFGE